MAGRTSTDEIAHICVPVFLLRIPLLHAHEPGILDCDVHLVRHHHDRLCL